MLLCRKLASTHCVLSWWLSGEATRGSPGSQASSWWEGPECTGCGGCTLCSERRTDTGRAVEGNIANLRPRTRGNYISSKNKMLRKYVMWGNVCVTKASSPFHLIFSSFDPFACCVHNRIRRIVCWALPEANASVKLFLIISFQLHVNSKPRSLFLPQLSWALRGIVSF